MVAGLDRAMGDFVFEFDDTFMDYPFEVLDRMYDSAVERVRRRRRRSRQPRVGPAVVLRGLQLVLGHPAAARLRAAARVVTARARRDAPPAGADPRPAGAVPLHRVPVPAARLPGRPVGRPPPSDQPALRAGRLLLVHRRRRPDLAALFLLLRSGVGPVDRRRASSRSSATGRPPWELVITSIIAVGLRRAVLRPGGGRRVRRSHPRRGAQPADLHDGQDPHLDDHADRDPARCRPASRRRSGSRLKWTRSRSWCASGESPRSTSSRSVTDRSSAARAVEPAGSSMTARPSPAPGRRSSRGCSRSSPTRRSSRIGRRDDDTVRLDLAAEFDVTAMPVDARRGTCFAAGLCTRNRCHSRISRTAGSLAVNLTSVVRICEHVLTNNPRARIAIVEQRVVARVVRHDLLPLQGGAQRLRARSAG